MKTLTKFAAAAVLVAGTSGTAMAQSSTMGFLHPPVLLAQPGVVTVNAISAPAGVNSSSGFNVRFTMLVPTSTPWFNFVLGTQFQPNGLGVYFLVDQQMTHLPYDASGKRDYFTPALLYGLTIPIAPWGR